MFEEMPREVADIRRPAHPRRQSTASSENGRTGGSPDSPREKLRSPYSVRAGCPVPAGRKRLVHAAGRAPTSDVRSVSASVTSISSAAAVGLEIEAKDIRTNVPEDESARVIAPLPLPLPCP